MHPLLRHLLRASKELQPILLKAKTDGRYLKLVSTHVLNDEPQIAVPEIALLTN